MITKDNIAEVLKHNEIEELDFSLWSGNSGVTMGKKSYPIKINFKNPNWLQIIEAHIGRKLEPLPEPHPFDAVRVGQWIRCIDSASLYQSSASFNNRYQRMITPISQPSIFYFIGDNKSPCTLSNPKIWDLSDIRDYNPDEEIVLKIGDEVIFSHTREHDIIERFDYLQNKISYKNTYDLSYFNAINNGHIQSVNGRQGKFVIPPFDFEETLLDAGFNQDRVRSSCVICNDATFELSFIWLNKNNNTTNGIQIKLTPQNAKLLIEIRQKFEELELA